MASIHQIAGWPHHTTLREIDLVIFDEYEEREGVGRRLFNVRDSYQYQEDTVTVGGIGTMNQKLEGAGLDYVALNEGFRNTFTHLDYGYGMRVTRPMLRDDLYGTMQKLGGELGRSARATEETILANHLNNGFSNSYTGPDALELFSSVHLLENGQTFRNELSTAADLSQTSLEQALIDFMNFRDGGNKRLAIEPKTLVVPADLRFTADKLIRSNYVVGSANNDVNPAHGMLDVETWTYLTDSDAWFLFADKSNHNMILYDREPFWTDYEYDFDTKDYKISGMFAQSSGWGDARGIFGTEGAG